APTRCSDQPTAGSWRSSRRCALGRPDVGRCRRAVQLAGGPDRSHLPSRWLISIFHRLRGCPSRLRVPLRRNDMAAYNIDTAHSEITFTVRHMMFAKVRGQFKTWTTKLAYDAADPTKSTVSVEIDAASIDTREAQRDGHLRAADFFEVEKFPKITFVSKRI